MRGLNRWKTALVVTGAVAAPLLVTGCMHHYAYDDGGYYGNSGYYGNGGAGSYGEYQPYVWNDAEIPYYRQWEYQSRREHREWRDRSDREHRQYWDWRRSHRSNDRDHDRRDRGDR